MAESAPDFLLLGMRVRFLIAGLLLLTVPAQPAAAATTVFASSIFSASGSVLAPGNALGAANGASAQILRVAGGSNLVLQLSQATTGLNTILNGQRQTLGSNVQVAIGAIIGGVATFSANSALPAGLGSLHTFDLSAACSAISVTGCSLLRISVNGAPGSGFLLDGISGVAAAPEPAAWALMLLGFGAVAWRLKRQRAAPAFAQAN